MNNSTVELHILSRQNIMYDVVDVLAAFILIGFSCRQQGQSYVLYEFVIQPDWTTELRHTCPNGPMLSRRCQIWKIAVTMSHSSLLSYTFPL